MQYELKNCVVARISQRIDSAAGLSGMFRKYIEEFYNYW